MVKLYLEPWTSCVHMVCEHEGISVWEGKWVRNLWERPFSWHEYGHDPHCFHYTSEDRLIVHPCNTLAPTHTGLHFHSLCISTCRATSGQRDIRSRDIPYSSFASLNFPPFIRRTAGWTSAVTSENLACLALQMSPIYLCALSFCWQPEKPGEITCSYQIAGCWVYLANKGKHSQK